ncbi:spermidine synthase [Virgisporangium ochraceum]|uniref:spermidine synthase n=1 Tax=Virgisporangium ochraceum TaxID=65505 RepID=UPI0035A2526A
MAALIPDAHDSTGWTLFIDGTQQSHVDTADPTRLEFEYMRRLGDVVDAVAPHARPIDALHLGGGAFTLPRYVAATRPGSTQVVIEHDAQLTGLVRRVLPLPADADIRVHAADARAALDDLPAGAFDLLVADVYDGASVPASLSPVSAAEAFARVLRPGGWYATNLSDGGQLTYVRDQVATLRAVFPDVLLIAEPGVLRGRRFGNVVLLAGPSLPAVDLGVLAARDIFPARVVHGAALDRFVADAAPVTDATACRSPVPPRLEPGEAQ